MNRGGSLTKSFIECLLCDRHFTYIYMYNSREQLRQPLEVDE